MLWTVTLRHTGGFAISCDNLISFTLCLASLKNTRSFPSSDPFDPAPFYFLVSPPSSCIFLFFLTDFFPSVLYFFLLLAFFFFFLCLSFISTSYGITVRLGEYNEAVPLQLQTFPSPSCQGSKTNPEQIFWHLDTGKDMRSYSRPVTQNQNLKKRGRLVKMV